MISTADNAWVDDVDGSYGYLWMDVDNVMNNSYISAAYNRQLRNMDKEDAELVNGIIKAFDYAYLSFNTPNSIEFVIVFDDKSTNALEQVVNQVMPYVTQRAARRILRQ